jgi:homoserine kinase
MKDAVFNVTHSSLLTAALAMGRLDLLSHAMRDRMHQPYRAALIPGMDRILAEATEHGALGAVLSGAGPTLLLLSRSEDSGDGRLIEFVQAVMAKESIRVSTRWLEPCLHGPIIRIIGRDDSDYGLEQHQLLTQAEAEVGA